MKYFIQYLNKGLLTGNPIEACGDRAIFILDGRNTLETMIDDAHTANGYKRPLYPYFRIMKGTFRDAVSIYSTIKNEKIGTYSGY